MEAGERSRSETKPGGGVEGRGVRFPTNYADWHVHAKEVENETSIPSKRQSDDHRTRPDEQGGVSGSCRLFEQKEQIQPRCRRLV